MRALNAHPEAQFLAETYFLVAHLWADVWDKRSWLRSQEKLRRGYEPGDDVAFEIPTDVVDAARERVARGVRTLFAELTQVNRTKAAWGCKEVWNGNDAVARVPWSVHQAVFPDAQWVHLVRDPFTFARSSARWNGVPLILSLLREELRHWAQVFTWSRLLKNQDRYCEIRYEDLSADPRACLTPVLASVGLTWHESCRASVRSTDQGVTGIAVRGRADRATAGSRARHQSDTRSGGADAGVRLCGACARR